MKHFDFEEILQDACKQEQEHMLLLMFFTHNPSFIEDPYNSNFYKGLESALDLSPLKELAPIRFPSDWTDQREKDFFLFLLFVSEFPFCLEWTEGEVHIYFPADGDWGRERKGLAPIHILPITEVKKYLPYFFMQTMRMFYINDPELTAAKSNLEDEVFDLSESIKAEL